MKMKTMFVLSIAVALFAVSLLAGTACAQGTFAKVSAKDLDTERTQIIDIRGEEQYIGWTTEKGPGGHVKNAIDFPESWLGMDFAKDSAICTTMELELKRRGLDTTKETVIYDNGTASDASARKYAEIGFEKLRILDGGYKAYVEAGRETEKLAHYEMYVYPQWVQDLADGKNPATYTGSDYKIIEIAFNEDEYLKGHIPTAIYGNTDAINHVVGPRALADYEAIPMEEQLKFWNRASDEKIQETLENLGITKDTTIVLYGTTSATTAAARAGLIMKYAGIKDIRILNGGKTLWMLEGRPMEKKENTPEKVNFGAKVPQNPDVIYDYDEEMKVVNGAGVVASIRSWPEYLCKISGYTYIGEAGDIANSRFGYAGSDPYAMEDYRNVDNTMFNYKMIEQRWCDWGITPDKEISFHCGTGWRASETYFYAYAMGWQNIHVYDGGWYEWHKRQGSPKKMPGLPADVPEQQPKEYFMKK